MIRRYTAHDMVGVHPIVYTPCDLGNIVMWSDVEPIILANEGYRELVRIRREENDLLRSENAELKRKLATLTEGMPDNGDLNTIGGHLCSLKGSNMPSIVGDWLLRIASLEKGA